MQRFKFIQEEYEWIPTMAIRFKLRAPEIRAAVSGQEVLIVWPDSLRPIEEIPKIRSMKQRFLEGRPWQDTDVFKINFEPRLRRGDVIRGCSSLDELARTYELEMNQLYVSLRDHGFIVTSSMSRPPHKGMPVGFFMPNGDFFFGHQGNHRLGICLLLGIEKFPLLTYRALAVKNTESDGL